MREQGTIPRKVRGSGVFTRRGARTVQELQDAIMALNIPVRRSIHSARDIVEKQKLYEKLPQVLIDYLNANAGSIKRHDRFFLHVGMLVSGQTKIMPHLNSSQV